MQTFTEYGTVERQKLAMLNKTERFKDYTFEYSGADSYEHWDARFFSTKINKWIYIESKCRNENYKDTGFICEINKFNYLKDIQKEFNAKIFYISFYMNKAYINELTNINSSDLKKEFKKRKETTAINGSKKEKTGYVYVLNKPQKLTIY